MGREAYLTRVVLGRSAFDEPLRDVNGDSLLGGQAHAFDDKSYKQQWTERGHPRNPETERHEKCFRKAQNEVLAACGVIIKKDKDRQQRVRRTEIADDTQLLQINAENTSGLYLKWGDRLVGNVPTWWTSALRKRITVFGSAHSSLRETIGADFSREAVSFLFAGFPTGVVAGICRIVSRDKVGEPTECMNYLDFTLSRTPLSWHERMNDWLNSAVWIAFEVPFEIVSTLQSLGFVVIPSLWSSIKNLTFMQLLTGSWILDVPYGNELARALIIYLVRDHLSYQLGWRIYGLLRQVLHSHQQPTRMSIQSAEDDEFMDDSSIVGIGRSLSPYTDRRFYGPQTLWAALPVAFPWLAFICRSSTDTGAIKREVLARCAMLEHQDSGQGPMNRADRWQNRVPAILNNLDSLDVDTEEDIFVDIGQWTMQLEDMQDEEPETILMPPLERVSPSDLPSADGYIPTMTDLMARSEPEYAQQAPGTPDQPFEIESATGIDEAITAPLTEEPAPSSTSGDMQHIEDVPPTPEMGIRRATSLSQTTPRPVRRPTETNGPYFDEDVEALLAEARRQKTPRKRKKAKAGQEIRVTRLTTFAVDSFAWHSSALITSLVLLPMDTVYLRSLSTWFSSATGSVASGSVLPMSRRLFGLPIPRFEQSGNYSMILLSVGLEGVVRGVMWHVGCRIATYYGEVYSWGKF